MQGILLANRALWLGVGAIFLAFAYAKFAFAYPAGAKSKRRQAAEEREPIADTATRCRSPIPAFSAAASLRHLLSLTRIQFRETTKNVFFLVLMLAGFLFAVLTAAGINNPLATRTYPVTYQMLQMAGAGFAIFAFAIIIFYSGELVWRERDAQLNQVIDAFPLQRWVLFSSKLLALMLVQVLVVLLIMASGLIGADRPGLPPLRVRPVLPRAVPEPPDAARGFSACWRCSCRPSSTTNISATS